MPIFLPSSIESLVNECMVAKSKKHSRFSSSEKRGVLDRFAERFGSTTPLENVSPDGLEKYFKVEMEHLAESTLAGYQSTILAFLNWCNKVVLELSRYFQLLGLENCKTRKVGLAN